MTIRIFRLLKFPRTLYPIPLYLIPLYLLTSCNTDDFSPRPKGYFRIDLPRKSYLKYDSTCPFTFEFHKKARINKNDNESCWMNIEYPAQNATIHISYKKIESGDSQKQIEQYIEDSRSLVYKHTVKATDIREDRIKDDSSNVYGLLYSLEGNTASSMQFYLTDSVNHFMRGALYFNVTTNVDSLLPVIRYIQDDILHLVNTFEWKKDKN